MNKIEINTTKNAKLSEILCEYGFSYNSVCKMLRNKDVRVDNVKISKDQEVFVGQNILCFCKELPSKKFEIIFEDENIYIINKKSGIEVEGENSIEEQLKNSIAVHRLDRNTEGLLIMAKNEDIKNELDIAIKNRQITKKYLCEVVGNTSFGGETFEAYLFKDSKKSEVKVLSKSQVGAVKIQTKFKTLKNTNSTSIVECELITGKTHQIRAHLSFLGHAILGDMKYGNVEDNKKANEKRQKLHCYYLKLNGLEKFSYLNNKEFVKLPKWIGNTKIGE